MKRALTALAFASIAATAAGQANTTSGSAADYFWGQKATSFVRGTPPATEFWFVLQAVNGRSYCVEAGNYEGEFGDRYTPTALFVYREDQLTLITSNGIALEEPRAGVHSRACWYHFLSTQNVFVKLSPLSAATLFCPVTLRFLETTLYSPWFFVAGDYNAFTLMRNTGDTALSGIVVTWRGLNGAFAGGTTVSIPANGGLIVNARDFVSPSFSNGTVEIAHPGAPDQIQASTTTLSATTGLSFDTSFAPRRPW